jgi:hypothetical protein
MTEPTAFPLHWPPHVRRAEYRGLPSFKVTLTSAIDGLLEELRLLGAQNVTLSTNVRPRLDGRPYGTDPEPADPGVAVYWSERGKGDRCIACDRWRTVAGNVRAVGLTVAALRGIARWGSSDMVEAAFRGFQALPETIDLGFNAWEFLGADPEWPRDLIVGQYRELLRSAHPDKGGSTDEFLRVRAAWAQITTERPDLAAEEAA